MRPPEVLNSLPWEFRWEFTRRHPYYQALWQAAQRHHQGVSIDDEQRKREEAAVLILLAIGVNTSQCPPDPSLGPEALGSRDMGGAWLGGAVAPTTLRELAHILLLALPKDERCRLGRLLNESSEFESDDRQHMSVIHERLAQADGEIWNSFPKAPFIAINLEMPKKAILEAVDKLVGEWKEEGGIAEHRRRDDKLGDYLAVWDWREGWKGGAYRGECESKFREMAEGTHQPLSTLISQYRKAFYYLSGHEYTPELWIQLMGPVKFSQYYSGAEEGLARHRPWRSPSPRPVSESVLLPGRKDLDQPKFLEAAGVTEDQMDVIDQAMDIQTLLAAGKSDEEICQTLELTSEQDQDFVAELRGRHESR